MDLGCSICSFIVWVYGLVDFMMLEVFVVVKDILWSFWKVLRGDVWFRVLGFWSKVMLFIIESYLSFKK